MSLITTGVNFRNSAGEIIDNDILEKYQIANSEDGATSYYGYVDRDGNWYIMKIISTTTTFVKGITDYATNWTNRASLTYQRFDLVF